VGAWLSGPKHPIKIMHKEMAIMFVGLVVACILLDSSSSSINPAFSITP
jgi:hypothetical protein